MNQFKIFFICTLFFWIAFILQAKSFTNVGGVIYTNTTWTLANSPYVVIDTVIVYPNVILTIEPGVEVRFEDSMGLEVRKGSLIAEGTNTDSITFTSNSSSPQMSSWASILLDSSISTHFYYCNFKYANHCIGSGASINSTEIIHCYFILNYVGFSGATTNIDSSIFENNYCGIGSLYSTDLNFCGISNNYVGIGSVNNSHINGCILNSNYWAASVFDSVTFTNCTIDSNTHRGIFIQGWDDTIANCEIKYNSGYGIFDTTHWVYPNPNTIINNIVEYNDVGIAARRTDYIHCNKICNNMYHDFANNGPLDLDLSNNYWCSSDTGIIYSKIGDGNDFQGLGIVNILPIDTIQCYPNVGITEDNFQNTSFSIFPNPANDILTINLNENISEPKIKIYNILGSPEITSQITKQNQTINIATLSSGLHIIEVSDGKNVSRIKFIKE